jgi:hypothetical protein
VKDDLLLYYPQKLTREIFQTSKVLETSFVGYHRQIFIDRMQRALSIKGKKWINKTYQNSKETKTKFKP